MANGHTASDGYDFKIVLLGEGCVGKTSLAIRYVEDKFNDKHITTLQAVCLTKKLNIGNKKINLTIWDTAGQEKFHALGPMYYRGSNGAILVYDITDERSFERVKVWVKELRKILGADVSLVIVGNKTDLEKDRHVTIEEAETYASHVSATHCHTSAKLNVGIEEMFLTLTQRMMERAAEQESQNPSLARQGSTRRNVVVVDDEVATPTKQCCSNS